MNKGMADSENGGKGGKKKRKRMRRSTAIISDTYIISFGLSYPYSQRRLELGSAGDCRLATYIGMLHVL